jgi:hypothetical protein
MPAKGQTRLKIISGGQTGVDRAALDAAIALGLPHGGWCPKGRRAEDGRIPKQYRLRETPSADFSERTEWNVRDSQGTLVLVRGKPQGGTAFTIFQARSHGKPYLVVRVGSRGSLEKIRRWLKANKIRVLNVAGPRESQQRGIYLQALKVLRMALKPY